MIDALEHMHAHSIVFRDLKPENVLLDSDGYCRVVDFGFAKVVEAQKQTYTILGTPEYLSPECVLGQGYRDDVDLWAYGVLTYIFHTQRRVRFFVQEGFETQISLLSRCERERESCSLLAGTRC